VTTQPEESRASVRQSWNAATDAHHTHHADLAGYLRDGGLTIFPEERELLGDVRGQRIAHLQCNSGEDSLSLAALGASVTGVDISDSAIAHAERLAAESDIPARFDRADLYDWLDAAGHRDERYDVVYTSYGVVCWLSDLDTWAAGIASILAPGGRFVMVEFHPFAATFDGSWTHRFPYGGGQTRALPEGVGDYVGEAGGGLTPSGFVEGVEEFQNPHPTLIYQWGIGEVVTALTGAGLVITALREFPWSNGERGFDGMRERPGRRMIPPEHVPEIPLMYGVIASKR